MTRGIKMALVMNLLYLFSIATLVRSDESTVPPITIKIGGNITYGCIDIHKQPGLNHPLLKNHKIQMKPSISTYQSRNQTNNNNVFKNDIGCPDGTVPILRDTKDFITNTSLFTDKYFHPQTVDNPGTHIAGVRSSNGPFHGVESLFNGYALNIKQDQASYSQIYIGSGLNKEVNFISVGWMINPSQFPDGRVWTYGYWKGKDGKGCYNTACSGFIQVSQKVPIVQPLDLKPGETGWFRYAIYEDRNTGNWWITEKFVDAPNADIGYWPKELFNLFNNGANMVGVGGFVKSSRSGLSPAMGNGNFPNENRKHSAMFSNVKVLNSNYKQVKISSFPIEKLLDSTKCFGIKIGEALPYIRMQLGYFFNYGGPGGNSCGI